MLNAMNTDSADHIFGMINIGSIIVIHLIKFNYSIALKNKNF